MVILLSSANKIKHSMMFSQIFMNRAFLSSTGDIQISVAEYITASDGVSVSDI